MRGVEPLLVVAGELPVHLHHLEEVRLDPGTVKHKLFRRVPETQSSGIRVRLLGNFIFQPPDFRSKEISGPTGGRGSNLASCSVWLTNYRGF